MQDNVVKLPTTAVLKVCESQEIERFTQDCFEVLRNRGDMHPHLETEKLDQLAIIDHLKEHATLSELEDLYYALEDILFERGVF